MQISPVQPYARLATRVRCTTCGADGHTARNCPRKSYVDTKVQGKQGGKA